jgi:hypothetical protein
MTLPDPMRLDRFQEALVSVLTDATGAQVAWAYGQGVYNSTFPGAFVNLKINSGPSYINQSAAQGYGLIPPEVIDFTVDAAVTGRLVALYVNTTPYRYQITGLDTPASVATAMVALIAADTLAPYTAANTGVGTFSLTPASLGSVWSVTTVGDLSADVTDEDDMVLVTQSQRGFNVGIQSFSKSRAPRDGAWNLASKAQAALELPDVALLLRDYGVGVSNVGPAFDLSAIAGGNWETRVNFDVDFNVVSTVVRPVSQIESLAFSTTVTKPLLVQEVTIQ